jgi:hypothetical protein
MRVRESQLRFPQEQESHVESHALLRILRCSKARLAAGMLAEREALEVRDGPSLAATS